MLKIVVCPGSRGSPGRTLGKTLGGAIARLADVIVRAIKGTKAVEAVGVVAEGEEHKNLRG